MGEETQAHDVSLGYADTAPLQATPRAAVQKDAFATAHAYLPSTAPEPGTLDDPKPPLWRRMLVPLGVLLLVGSLVAVGLRLHFSGDDSNEPAPAAAAAPSVERAVVAAHDFDPVSNGGNGEEHPNQVALASSSSPSCPPLPASARVASPRPGSGADPATGLGAPGCAAALD